MLPEVGFTGLIPLDEVAPQELHRVADFVSGRDGLDEFLRDRALDLHKDRLSSTSVLFHEEFHGLVGYITLANDGIPLTAFEVGELGLSYQCNLEEFPAVKICRLAVHQELQGQGIGRRLFDLALGQILATLQVTSARFLITDAVNEEPVLAFYKSLGFEESYWASEKAKHHTKKGAGRPTIKMLRDLFL